MANQRCYQCLHSTPGEDGLEYMGRGARGSIQESNERDFLGGPVAENPPGNAGDAGLIPGWGTKIPPCCNYELVSLSEKIPIGATEILCAAT